MIGDRSRARAGTSERERVSILTSLQSWIVTLVNYLACVAGGFFACFFACFAAAVSSSMAGPPQCQVIEVEQTSCDSVSRKDAGVELALPWSSAAMRAS